uniref:Histone-lysine N-methyltransferase SUVR5 n=1 Tax=Nelumbo nucifera TaxID=4432 RepID=A0A822XRK9_NELNU|nr:TPA_asm: hypothetical protein HUJ06_023244 [Nelumbo nucifera]
MQLVRSIHEFPEPIAHRTHYAGVKMVKDLTIPRRFIMQKLAVSMLNISEQLHSEAVVESARKVTAWKEFAIEASRCKGYSDLGRMLLKLQSMILQRFISPDWLQHSFDSWAQQCQNAQSAESVELLKEELINSILWNEVGALWNAPVQPQLNSEWKTWKQEVMKWFSMSHPLASGRETGQQSSDDSTVADVHISRKRPKLEVRRADMYVPQVQSQEPHGVPPQDNTVEIETEFFNRQGVGNATALVSEPCKTFAETHVPSEYSNGVASRWEEIVVEPDNPKLMQTTETEEMHVDGVGKKPLDPGNKYRQCMAFIEAKQRQCGRWANDGDVYCCVHLAVRSLGKVEQAEQGTPVNTPMCEGTTTHGTRCKHRSQYGSPFCKKHRLNNSQSLMDAENSSSLSVNKRMDIEKISSSETTYCKEITLAAEMQNPVGEQTVLLVEQRTLDANKNSIGKCDHSIKDDDSGDLQLCIGSSHQNNSDSCPDNARLHTLYCEKHLPSWLKRARNGKSRIISKEVFIELLRGCSSRTQKLHLHRACELLYNFVKSVLSLRNPVPRGTQLQWILSEASKDLCVGEYLMKLVSYEKEKLKRLWGLDDDKNKPVFSTGTEQAVLMSVGQESSQDVHKTVKCKICTEQFFDDEGLGNHWMDVHKKEAQWLFRGYACAICMNSFTNKKVLETHVTERHGVQFLEQCILFQCIPCASHFVNPEQLWLHVLSVHSMDFKLSGSPQQHVLSTSQASPPKLGVENKDAVEDKSTSQGELRKFICRFCGLKFDLLPDLGRHHQAAHMDPNAINQRPPKRGIHINAYRLKSGRLSRPSFNKSLGAASFRIKNRGNLSMKKRIQSSSSVSTGQIKVQTQVKETTGFGSLEEHQCSNLAKILFSESQKTKLRPNNLEILSIARSSCCRKTLETTLADKYGVLPERFYLKAAKLCSELNIEIKWHQEGFICPKGCRPFMASNHPHLMPLPSGLVESISSQVKMSSEGWEMDECHHVIDCSHIKSIPMRKEIVLCEDVSFGRESVPVACVVDENLMGSLPNTEEQKSSGRIEEYSMPWEGFVYVTERLIHPSLGLDTESKQLGCVCPGSMCYPEKCDHVYLFDNDYENAKDIFGKPMYGRFPYDEHGQIILEEGYLVYECNSMCSCDKTCGNRVLQNGVRVKLEVFKTENKGWAVRAGEAISRGTFVCEYIGEVLTDQEAKRRSERYGYEGCSYLYSIDPHINDINGLTEGAVPCVIDATTLGNVSRFINHSCSPNLVSYLVLVESMDCQLAHIGLYASRNALLWTHSWGRSTAASNNSNVGPSSDYLASHSSFYLILILSAFLLLSYLFQ